MLKAEYPNTLTSMANLAPISYPKKRHDEAIALLKKIVELKTKLV